ncbi:LysR substrate-binding domain-containing protein [Novosphingobium olei]|uniref:LysR family transcriptional regulator n=1 Tax=Novosphingobium olei TaxID=2728851 RepID=A0A7Y0BS90_9SPHN|nr:LysR family transcriptional regulator [Novosphingobium olei]
MRLGSRFDLNLLGVFEAIYARSSVTHAARHLNLSQSAVSHALARLRRELNDQLFVRVDGKLVPTALATTIIEPVRRALHGLESAIGAAHEFDPAHSARQFRIGLRPNIEARMFADLAVAARAAAPFVQLASVDFRRADLARALALGELDVALDVESEATAGLQSRKLRLDVLVVAARRDNPLVADGLTLAAYLDAQHAFASPRPAGQGTEDLALQAIGAERQIGMRCQGLSTAWDIVARSDLLLTLPQSHAETLLHRGGVTLFPLPLEVPPRPLKLFWHEVVEGDGGNAWLRELITGLLTEQHAEDS